MINEAANIYNNEFLDVRQQEIKCYWLHCVYYSTDFNFVKDKEMEINDRKYLLAQHKITRKSLDLIKKEVKKLNFDDIRKEYAITCSAGINLIAYVLKNYSDDVIDEILATHQKDIKRTIKFLQSQDN